MSKTDSIRIAVIGAGYWGPNLVRNFSHLTGSRVTMVCDLDRGRLDHLKELYPAIRVSQDAADVMSDPEVDAVCVATPVASHYAMAKAALLAGKHVLVEKPLTASLAEARELVQIAKEQGLILLVDHTFQYSPAVEKVKEIVRSGELGDVFYVSMSRLNLGLFQKDINVVWDLAPHDVSILNYVLETLPDTVSAQGNSNILPGIEDVAMVTLTYPENIIAYLHVSWLDPSKIRRSTFVGSKKMLVYDDVEPLEKIKIYDKGVDGPRHYDTFGEFQFSYRYGDIYTPYLDSTEPLQVVCLHFLECVRGTASPRSGGEDGLNVVRVLEAAQRSLKNGGSREKLK